MSYGNSAPPVKPGEVTKWIGTGAIALTLVITLLFGGITGCKAFSRYQDRADRSQSRSQALKDANNQVKITAIEIQNQGQRVEVAKQKAEIRKQDAIGVREAQDEIAKTLTPLYVQYEMVEAIKEIAQSGSNSSVIFIPSGNAGIPLITDAIQSLHDTSEPG